MLLVCDSGSTKADWLLYDGNKIAGPYHSIGFNQYFNDSDFVYQRLSEMNKKQLQYLYPDYFSLVLAVQVKKDKRKLLMDWNVFLQMQKFMLIMICWHVHMLQQEMIREFAAFLEREAIHAGSMGKKCMKKIMG